MSQELRFIFSVAAGVALSIAIYWLIVITGIAATAEDPYLGLILFLSPAALGGFVAGLLNRKANIHVGTAAGLLIPLILVVGVGASHEFRDEKSQAELPRLFLLLMLALFPPTIFGVMCGQFINDKRRAKATKRNDSSSDD